MVLSNESIIVILFVGLVAGWLAGKIVRGTGFGIIGDILVGIAGAFIAALLFPKLGIHIGTGIVSEIILLAIFVVSSRNDLWLCVGPVIVAYIESTWFNALIERLTGPSSEDERALG